MNLDKTFAINYDNDEMKSMAENLSKFINFLLKNKAKNILLLTNKNTGEDIFKKIEELDTQKIYVISCLDKFLI
jgi:predicted Ser/Thr protein kinase